MGNPQMGLLCILFTQLNWLQRGKFNVNNRVTADFCQLYSVINSTIIITIITINIIIVLFLWVFSRTKLKKISKIKRQTYS